MQTRRIAAFLGLPGDTTGVGEAGPAVGVRKARSHEIDGLRGIAIALVLVAHMLNASLNRGLGRHGLRLVADGITAVATSGLELFFVVSAYLLLSPHVRGGRPMDTGNYFKRRIQRLWPPYLVALFFASAVVVIARSRLTWYSTTQLPRPSLTSWAAQLGIVNFGWTTYNGAWWSLTLEILFYVCVPAIVAALVFSRSPRGGRALIGIVAALSVASFLVASPVGVVHVDRTGAEAFAYLPCFLMGMLLARFSLSTRLAGILTATGAVLALIGIADRGLNPHVGFGIFYAGVIGLATSGRVQPKKVLTHWRLVWLGERSYSLFLVHFSVFYLADYVVSLLVPSRSIVFDAASRALGLPFALLAAMTLFWYVERRAARGLVTADSFWPWRQPAPPTNAPAPPTNAPAAPTNAPAPSTDAPAAPDATVATAVPATTTV